MEERAEIRAGAKRLAKAGGQLQQSALEALRSGIQIDEPCLGGSPTTVDALFVVRESRAQLGELILQILDGPFSALGGPQAHAFRCARIEPPIDGLRAGAMGLCELAIGLLLRRPSFPRQELAVHVGERFLSTR